MDTKCVSNGGDRLSCLIQLWRCLIGPLHAMISPSWPQKTLKVWFCVVRPPRTGPTIGLDLHVKQDDLNLIVQYCTTAQSCPSGCQPCPSNLKFRKQLQPLRSPKSSNARFSPNISQKWASFFVKTFWDQARLLWMPDAGVMRWNRRAQGRQCLREELHFRMLTPGNAELVIFVVVV